MSFFNNILATIDLGDPATSESVMQGALELLDDGDTLNVICVVPSFGTGVVGSFFPEGFEENALKETKNALHEFTAKHVPKGTKLQHIIAHGNVYEEIIDAADKVNADVIVIGSQRPKLRDYLLGPNAARVVRHAEQSVVVVRARQ
jgi:nucleotide-binding universal stress UspA family protein